MNTAKKVEILALIDTAAKQSEWDTPQNKKIIAELKASFDVEEKAAEKTKEVEAVPVKVAAAAERVAVKQEVIYNLPIVKDYAQKINLGSALALLSTQSGEKLTDKSKAAIKAIKDSGAFYNSSSEEGVKEVT